MLHSGSHDVDDLEWIGRMSGPLLLNNNLLVDRSGSSVLRNDNMGNDKRMGYTVEPSHVPI